MTDDQRRAFLLDGTRTGILATVRRDGRPHAAPIWFTLDGDDVIFTTGADTVKGRNLRRTGRALVVVDESTPPFDFVTVEGAVEISEDLDEMLRWATVLGGRYMGTLTYVIRDSYGFPVDDTLGGFGPPMRYLQTVCGAPRHAGGAHWFPDSVTVTVPFDQPA